GRIFCREPVSTSRENAPGRDVRRFPYDGQRLTDDNLPAPHKTPRGFPSKDDLLTFVADKSGKVGTREIARAFGLKNADRAALKTMLRELAADGGIARRRKKLHHAGALPAVVMADITGRDRDGELIAVPTEWDTEAHGEAPKIRLMVPRKARPGEI